MKNGGAKILHSLINSTSVPAWNDSGETEILPERRLMCAILQRAVLDLKDDRANGEAWKFNRRCAQRWFLEEDSGYHFSFCSVCEYLGVDCMKILNLLLNEGLLEFNRHQYF